MGNNFNRDNIEHEKLKFFGLKIKCYGQSSALCAEATFTQGSESIPTINLEVAPKDGKDYAWARKIIIQLSDNELPLVCCVLMGYIPSVHLKRQTKGIEIRRQKNSLYVKASSGKDNVFALPITIGDTFKLSTIMLKQLIKQTGLESETLVLAALRGAASLYNDNPKTT